MRKRSRIQKTLMLAAPAKQITAEGIRSEIVSKVNDAKQLLREPESSESDVEEKICWLFLLLPVLENLSAESEGPRESEWWYRKFCEEVKSEKQLNLLALVLNHTVAA